MELTHRTLGVRRTAALVAVTAAAALAIPAAANAAVDGVRTSATTATLTGDEANDNIAISVSGDNLAHNITGNGFDSEHRLRQRRRRTIRRCPQPPAG